MITKYHIRLIYVNGKSEKLFDFKQIDETADGLVLHHDIDGESVKEYIGYDTLSTYTISKYVEVNAPKD